MSAIIKTEALVIYSMRWQESSKIVHLFSADQGYIKIIAKGAFRPKSPFRGVMEALNHIEAVISSKETRGLQILTSASLLNSFMNIRENLDKTAVSFAILELLKKLFSVHEPVQPFFQYIIELLSALNSPDAGDAKLYLNHFLLNLSKTLGFGWNFKRCLSCKKSPEQFPVMLDYQNGGVICGNCLNRFPVSGNELTRAQWEQMVRFSDLAAASLPEWSQSVPENAIPDTSDVLLKHITHHTELSLDLKSLKWYV